MNYVSGTPLYNVMYNSDKNQHRCLFNTIPGVKRSGSLTCLYQTPVMSQNSDKGSCRLCNIRAIHMHHSSNTRTRLYLCNDSVVNVTLTPVRLTLASSRVGLKKCCLKKARENTERTISQMSRNRRRLRQSSL